MEELEYSQGGSIEQIEFEQLVDKMMIMMIIIYKQNTHKTYRSDDLKILNVILLHTSPTAVEAVDATG